uniref:Uncharacterized protein n=1 Tax=Solanum tuberosum TaxID=4113 RepID=M1AQQ9_SOLTU
MEFVDLERKISGVRHIRRKNNLASSILGFPPSSSLYDSKFLGLSSFQFLFGCA